MAEQGDDAGDRTEEATPERREEFREKGQVAISQDLVSVSVLAGCVLFLSLYIPTALKYCARFMLVQFQTLVKQPMTANDFNGYMQSIWMDALLLILPVFGVAAVASIAITLAQTRLSWSWTRIVPDFNRLNPMSNLGNIFRMQTIVNLGKSIGKMLSVGLVAYLILYDEWGKMPALMNTDFLKTWTYWAAITKSLCWAVAAFLVGIAVFDYFYSFMSFENKLKMTKQEVKEDLKRRELDPYVKGRQKKMQRDIAMAKVITGTRKATVLVTNPTHYSIALQYEVGMPAPRVVAKGVDFLALRMREVAKEMDIPIVENKPLARTLYKIVNMGEFIPESLYKAVSEVIRFVFKLKGKKLPARQRAETVEVG